MNIDDNSILALPVCKCKAKMCASFSDNSFFKRCWISQALTPHLEGDACQVDRGNEGEDGGEEDGEQEVAAALGAPEAVVRADPRALRGVDALGLAYDGLPANLKIELWWFEQGLFWGLVYL